MTRDEAITIMQVYKEELEHRIAKTDYDVEAIDLYSIQVEAYDMAIEALSAEAVQGEWIDTGNWMGVECSRCKCHSRYVTPFCPQCGARMKGGEDDGKRNVIHNGPGNGRL